nr:FCD domain-containing protein [Pseudenhygromyxa sp. WMMC2535]
MRAALAPDIARLCAERAAPELVAGLRELVASMRETAAEDDEAALAALQQASLELWDLLVQGSENIAYRLAFNTLRRTYEQLREVLLLPLAAELAAVDRCAALVEAVAAGDGQRAHEQAEGLVALGSAGVQTAFELLAALESGPAPGPDPQAQPKEPKS